MALEEDDAKGDDAPYDHNNHEAIDDVFVDGFGRDAKEESTHAELSDSGV